jgi:hypothetical protein
MLIYSNRANGKVTEHTQITQYSAIENYAIHHGAGGYVIYANLVSGRSVELIVIPSYDRAVEIIEKIEREATTDGEKVDLRFLQVHPA